MKMGATVLAFAWLTCASKGANEGRIAFSLYPRATLHSGQIEAAVRLTNAGDETAFQIWIEVYLATNRTRSAILGSLAPGETQELRVRLGPAPPLAGLYTVAFKIHYADATGRPFSTVTTIPVLTADLSPTDSAISASLCDAEIVGRSELSLTLHSRTDEPIAVAVTFLTPDELTVEPARIFATVSAKHPKTFPCKVTDTAALPGSMYRVFAIVAWNENGQHRSLAVPARIMIARLPSPLLSHPRACAAAAILLLVAWAVVQFRDSPVLRKLQPVIGFAYPILVLGGLLAFILYFVPPRLLLLNTTTVGGDTPAHNYLASRLAENLFHHGRILSWAGGWWCGFPMFQFYFCLPYVFMAFLSRLVPFNMAFKLVSVMGIIILPPTMYASGRMFRMSRPAAGVLAMAAIPLLFDASHTMWGVNIYSTFAGMIANSLSFPLMLLGIAAVARDTSAGQFRLTTAIMLAALLASHFFTSVMGLLTTMALPLLWPEAGKQKAFCVLIKEWGLALLLMAWWLVPLLAKQEYSVDFGVNWKVNLLRHLPRPIFFGAPLLVAALLLGWQQRHRFVMATAWMLLTAVLLFVFGFDHVSPVFVNVRLWPFILYALLALEAAAVGLLLDRSRMPELACLAAMLALLTWGIPTPNHGRAWAEWNYSGLECKRNWPLFRDLVLPLKGTAGRLANDLHEANNSFGSSRIFECVPHLIGKPVLEGGLVNSAVGALFAYYIQGETSRSSAGYPSLVTPATFNLTNATRHLELFNVKHFIARWEETKKGLAELPEWRVLRTCGDWTLFELTSHAGHYVFIPRFQPVPVRVRDWKRAALSWFYEANALDQPFIILGDREVVPSSGGPVLSEHEFQEYLRAVHEKGFFPLGAPVPLSTDNDVIKEENVTDTTITFRTQAPGQPHLIKCNYFPNWKARGAERIYRVSPAFMLVYPKQEQVTVYYGSTWPDNLGRLATAAGWCFALSYWFCHLRRPPRPGAGIGNNSRICV